MAKNYYINGYYLDDYQMELIENNTNTMVIAGAGSGKTLSIIAKINYLIDNDFCFENEILVISFTNSSVNDIKKRISHNIDVFTFHKLAIKILNAKNISFETCPFSLLEYITNELLTCVDKIEQKSILNFLKLHISYSKFIKSSYFSSFCNLITTFINLFKSNNMNYEKIRKIKYNKTEKEILAIIFKILYSYNLEKKSSNILDYDDLIILATTFVKDADLVYKYIIIDEFQDTSLIRLNLIKEIYNYTNAKIIAVGDDYQSIYRFSGCDLNIFLNFNKYFPNVKEIKLINTYRNSMKLITIASKFITQNPLQIKKELVSNKRCDTPLILVPYTNKIQKLKEILNSITNYSNDIMILSRNYKDIYSYIDKEYILADNLLTYKEKMIKYFTVHKSKGLEAEFVIVLNCNNDYLGFPNKIENNILIEKLLPSHEIMYAEERRLFYVAITRCKEKTFLLYDNTKPSIFIKEIKKIIKKLNNLNKHIPVFKQ